VRSIRYREIADDLRSRVLDGVHPAGRVLPSEAELSTEFGASRVTVRRALEVLREEGLVDARQGFGWFVAGHPLRQPLASLGTIEEQLADSGHRSERRVLRFAFVPAAPAVAAVLGPGEVLEVARLNLADGAPFARVTVWCPEPIGRRLTRRDVESATFHDLLPVELGGATQTIGAAAATPADAAVLDVPPGSPVLVARRVTHAAAGPPVLVSEHVFPAHLTEFSVDLPARSSPVAAEGVRLVPERLGS
jgi:GntR family transcriptional regulator